MIHLKFYIFHFALILSTLWLPGCHGQPAGYRLEATIKGCQPGDSLLLARMEGSEKIVVDRRPWTSGKVIFSGAEPLKPGMYSFFAGNWGKADLLISDSLSQRFSFSADARQLNATITFEGSPENSGFVSFQRMLGRQSELRRRLFENQQNPDSLNRLSSALKQINGELSSLSAGLLEQFPDRLLALFLRTLKEPVPPEPSVPLMVTDRDRYLQEYYFRYRKEHFWDEIPFSDPRLITLPVYNEKLRFYFQQLVEPSPVSAEQAVDEVLAKAGARKEVYRFTVKSLFRLFRESPLPAVIPVSAYIGENFVLNRKEMWEGDPYPEQISEKVAKARLNPIGSMATDLNLVRNSGERLRLSEVNAGITILYFFNPDCESCHPVTEKLLPLYHRYKSRGVEVYAVYLDKKRETWEGYISAKKLDWINVYDPSGEEAIESKYDIYAIPMIYVLARDKKIIARDVPVEELEDYLRE